MDILLIILLVGLMGATAAVTGQNLGAGQTERAAQAPRVASRIGLFVGACVLAVLTAWALAAARQAAAPLAEARAAGRQLRVIHRMWQLQEQAHDRQRAARARWSNERARSRGQHVPEPEKRTVLDVADEIGPALRLPAGTAVRRVENAVLLAVRFAAPDAFKIEPADPGLAGREVVILHGEWTATPDT